MNFFVIFTIFMLLSSYCMLMWHHSTNFMDSVILKQNYEQKYYLCQALLDYATKFYKSNSNLLNNSGQKIFNHWPDYNQENNSYSGKITWEKLEKTDQSDLTCCVKITVELINNSTNKSEFKLSENLKI